MASLEGGPTVCWGDSADPAGLSETFEYDEAAPPSRRRPNRSAAARRQQAARARARALQLVVRDLLELQRHRGAALSREGLAVLIQAG
eukprot:9486201-Alexandrium_andersonii.AAC.1